MNTKVQMGAESLFEQNTAINSGAVFLKAVTMLQPTSCFLFKPLFKKYCSKFESGGPEETFKSVSLFVMYFFIILFIR